jgi:hypothetical protein
LHFEIPGIIARQALRNIRWKTDSKCQTLPGADRVNRVAIGIRVGIAEVLLYHLALAADGGRTGSQSSRATKRAGSDYTGAGHRGDVRAGCGTFIGAGAEYVARCARAPEAGVCRAFAFRLIDRIRSGRSAGCP